MNATPMAAVEPEPCGLVIFGASGDLAARKLLPALLQLYRSNSLHERSYILGVGRTPLSDADFRERVRGVESAGDAPIEFLKRCFFQVVDYDEEGSYKALAARLAELDHAHTDAARTLFYLATPPDVAQAVVERLGRSGLAARRARWMDSHRARETVRQRSPDREAHEQRAQRGFRGIPDLSHRPLSG